MACKTSSQSCNCQCSSLLSLPSECIAIILQQTDTTCRCTCKQLYELCGPLTGGLRPSSLSSCRSLNKALSLGTRCRHVHTLDLSMVCSSVRDSTLATISMHCQSLQILILKDCIHITSSGMLNLKSLSSSLEYLDVTGCIRATHNLLQCLLPLTSLKTLKVPESNSLWRPDQQSCLLQLPSLQHFETSSIAPETSSSDMCNASLAILAASQNLCNLSLPSASQLTVAGLVHLASLSALTSLNLGCCPAFRFSTLPQYSNLRSLHSLQLSGISSNEDIHNLAALPNLQNLNLTLPSFSDAILLPLCSCTSLAHLSIRLSTILPSSNTDTLTEFGLAHLTHLAPSLCSLSLPYINITPNCRSHLLQLTQLTSFSLVSARHFHQCISLSALPSLHTLSLGHRALLSSSRHAYPRQELSQLPQLTKLELRHGQLHNHDLALISSLSQLKQLEAMFGFAVTDLSPLSKLCGLEELALGHMCCDDSELRHLGLLHELRVLEIREFNEITGKGLSVVTGLRKLQRLGVMSCAEVDNGGLLSIVPPPSSLQRVCLARLPMVWNGAIVELQRSYPDLYIRFRNA